MPNESTADDGQWFANNADEYPRMQSVAFIVERDVHASMYRDLYADAQKELARVHAELHRERQLRGGAEADRRRMLQMVLTYMTTMTIEERKADQTFRMSATVSQFLLATARQPREVIHHILANIGHEAIAKLEKSNTPESSHV